MIANCRTTVALLPIYVDAALSPDEEQAVRSHLAICARCVELIESYRATSRIVREATDVEPPVGAETRLLDFLAARIRPKE